AHPRGVLRRHERRRAERLLRHRDRRRDDQPVDARARRVGPVSFRTYFDVPGADASRLLEQVVAQRTRVAERLATVGRVIVVLSGATPVGEAHTWRGPAETSVLREFLADVQWGALDALLVDMPPDAGRLGDLATLVPRIAGAVAVTIPSDESARSVARALDAA